MIHRDPSIQHGQPVVQGSRMPVETIRDLHYHGGIVYVQEQYPHLTQAQIDAALGHRWRYRWLRLREWLGEPIDGERWQLYGLIVASALIGGMAGGLW